MHSNLLLLNAGFKGCFKVLQKYAIFFIAFVLTVPICSLAEMQVSNISGHDAGMIETVGVAGEFSTDNCGYDDQRQGECGYDNPQKADVLLPDAWETRYDSYDHSSFTATKGGGTLTRKELDELQTIADKHDTTIDVVGSRAAGKGRNIDQPELPVGKGPGTRSDIDTRIDTTHPDADNIIKDVNEVSGGAGNASRKHSTADRPTYPPFIRIKPRKK